ncbi:CoA transferase [Pseudorhodoferax sp. LjRoot39]|uniref:CaiB/BaiF CoA transferase family protein n=1 Tax=Pseudorhodoferax sp. LjRoot39 TaxID=3342328 RepID=UPI003ECD53B3
MTAPPLAHLRVLDLSWVMVGPMSGRYLADFGADVIKVESAKRIDPLRTLGPYRDGTPHPERTLSYHFINAGKRSLALDLSGEAGRGIVRRLARHVDVVIESFTAGTLDRMGLGWERLRLENPRLVMAASCLFGQTGPHRSASGVGTLGAAYSGASQLTGWPDRAPTGPFNAWTDSVTPRFLVAGLLAALRRRDLTGQGCYLDVAQAEAGLQFLLPAWFAHAANGTVPQRQGDAVDPLRAPSGVFRCAGEDRWIALDASADVHWQALRRLAAPQLDAADFGTLLGRLRHRGDLHAQLSAWTADQNAEALEHALQAQGIPAHVVCDHAELATDADLLADGYYGQISDPQIGTVRMRNAQCAITPAAPLPARPAPRIGDATQQVLQDVAGYTDEEIDAFRRDGVLT